MATKQDAKIDKEHEDNGWKIMHAQEAVTANDSPTGAAVPGHYIALKRDPSVAGESPVEMAAQDMDTLNEMIADWERGRPVAEGEGEGPSKEQLEESAKATVHSLITSGARVSRDVDLTPAAEKAKPEAIRVSSSPPIEVEELEEEDAAVVAGGASVTSGQKLTDVGTGSKSKAAAGK
jgi:hypothetical protein